MPTLTEENRLITTQCQTCLKKFSVHEYSLDPAHNTLCPHCGSRIKIALCPTCGISYSIVTDKLAPNVYTTKCKRCTTQFTIEITDSSKTGISRNAYASKKQTDFSGTQNRSLPGTDSRGNRERGGTISPFSGSRTYERNTAESSSGRMDRYSREDKAFFSSYGQDPQKRALFSGKPDSAVQYRAKESGTAQTPARPGMTVAPLAEKRPDYSAKTVQEAPLKKESAEQDNTHAYVAGSAKRYFDKKESERYSLRNVYSLYMRAFQPGRLLIGAAGSAITALMMYVSSFLSGSAEYAGSPYITSFLLYIPIALLYAGYVATASAIARSVLNENSRQNRYAGCLKSAVSALLSSTVTGGTAVLGLNAALVFLTRIPQGGTLMFALVFLPVYLGSLFFALLLTAGAWLMPQIHAKHDVLFIGAYRQLSAEIRKYGGRLFYYIPLMGASAALLTGFVLTVHRFAFMLTENVSLAFSAGSSTKAYSLVPVSLQKFSELITRGGGSALAGLVSGNISAADSSAGMLLGALLCVVTLFLYGTLLSLCATISSQTLYLMERGGEISESEKRKGLLTALLLALLVGAVRFLIW